MYRVIQVDQPVRAARQVDELSTPKHYISQSGNSSAGERMKCEGVGLLRQGDHSALSVLSEARLLLGGRFFCQLFGCLVYITIKYIS